MPKAVQLNKDLNVIYTDVTKHIGAFSYKAVKTRTTHKLSPVSHLFPFGEHFSRSHFNRQVEPLTEITHNALLLEQQRHSVH